MGDETVPNPDEWPTSADGPRGGGGGDSGRGRGNNVPEGGPHLTAEFNFVAMSDVARDHDVLPVISPQSGNDANKASHAYSKHGPGNENVNTKGEHGQFDTHRAYLEARRQTFAAHDAELRREAAIRDADPSKNPMFRVSHTLESTVGYTDLARTKPTNTATFALMRNPETKKWHEQTGFPKEKK